MRAFAAYVGAPIIHAAHVGSIECQLPWMPIAYKGHYEAGAMIVDGKGETIEVRHRHEGQGIVFGDIAIGRTKPRKDIPNKYWLHNRGFIPAFCLELSAPAWKKIA